MSTHLQNKYFILVIHSRNVVAIAKDRESLFAAITDVLVSEENPIDALITTEYTTLEKLHSIVKYKHFANGIKEVITDNEFVICKLNNSSVVSFVFTFTSPFHHNMLLMKYRTILKEKYHQYVSKERLYQIPLSDELMENYQGSLFNN